MLVKLDNSPYHYECYKELLSEFGDTSHYTYAEHQNYVYRSENWYGKTVYLLIKNETVVGTCCIILDYKIFHDAFAIHLEDVVIHKDSRGKGLGQEMVREVIEKIKEYGNCYKIILDCNESNVEFYTAVGFSRHEVEMRLDLSVKKDYDIEVSTTG